MTTEAQGTGARPLSSIFVVLQPDVTVEEFLEDLLEEQIYAYAETDRDGRFVLRQPIPRGERFGVLVGAEGHTTQWENDWLYFDENDPAQVDLGTFRLASQR